MKKDTFTLPDIKPEILDSSKKILGQMPKGLMKKKTAPKKIGQPKVNTNVTPQRIC